MQRLSVEVAPSNSQNRSHTSSRDRSGSALVSYTDGLLGQQMKSGDQLGEEGVMDAIRESYGSGQPVDGLIQHVLDGSEVREFGDDILLFWLQREADRDAANDRPAPRWFSPFGEGHSSGQGAF